MAKKPVKAAPKQTKAESEEAPESLGGGQEGHGFAPGDMSKSEAIRRAIAAGFEGPQEGTAYILQEFGIEIAPGHFSAVKATEKKKAAAPKGKPGRKPKAAVEGYLAPPSKPQAAGEQPDLLAAIEAMKPLVEALGADKVKRIADLLG